MDVATHLAASLFPFAQDNLAPAPPDYADAEQVDAMDDFSAATSVAEDDTDPRDLPSPMVPGELEFFSFPSPSASWSSFEDDEEPFHAAQVEMDWRFAAATSISAAPIARAMRKSTLVEDAEAKPASLSLMDVIPSSLGCCDQHAGATIARELFRADADADLSDDEEDGFGNLLTETAYSLVQSTLEAKAAVDPSALLAYESELFVADATTVSLPATRDPVVSEQLAINPLYMSVQPMRKARAKNLNIKIVMKSEHDEDTDTLAGSGRENSFDSSADSASENSSVATLFNTSPDRLSAGINDGDDVEGIDGDGDEAMSSDDADNDDNDWSRSGSVKGSTPRAPGSPASIAAGTRKRPRAKSAAARAMQKVATPPTPHGRPYTCEFCPAGFIRKHDLKRHERIHLGELEPTKGTCLVGGQADSSPSLRNRHQTVYLRLVPKSLFAIGRHEPALRRHGLPLPLIRVIASLEAEAD